MKNFLAANSANEYGEDSSDALIAGKWEINDLDVEAIACFEHGGTSDGKLVAAIAPDITAAEVQFAAMRTTYGHIYGPPIARNSTLNVEKLTAVAGVAKVMFVGANSNTVGSLNPVTGAAGVWTLIVVVKKSHEVTDRQFVLSEPFTADDTESTIADAMVAAWNADVNASAIAAAVKTGDSDPGYGMSLTGVDATYDFTVWAHDDISNSNVYEYEFADRVYSSGTSYNCTKYVKSINYGIDLRDDELEGEARKAISQEGRTKQLISSGGPGSMLTAASAYTTYTFTWRNTKATIGKDKDSTEQVFVLAILQTNTQLIADMDNIVAAL